MFPGFQKPEKKAALKQLRIHGAMFGAWVVAIRVTPYILNYFSHQKQELSLDF